MSSRELATFIPGYSNGDLSESSFGDKIIVRDQSNVCDENMDIEDVWSADILPHSWYQERILGNYKEGKRYADKMIKAEAKDIYRISPGKLSKALTSIDLSILRRITPNELVDYDGTGDIKCRNIRHMRSKNAGLTNFVSHELLKEGNYKYFFRVLKHLKKIGNYNSFYCVVRAFQMQKLDTKRLDTLSRHIEKSASYFDMRQVLDDLTTTDMFLICPMDVYIRDVEESNRTKNNEVASMRFCRLVEILIKLQGQASNVRISYANEHFLLSKFWYHLQKEMASDREFGIKRYEGQFLLI
ncbi:uncharacterized protein Eint_070210 [Encephalitozoon intestinalis ATCC 50506]|uniref:Ras-GEF domain-containing protein n=1 Tax=Encephalitozoon intestinalis (strain ATCC 50506) TaxID=876142 RepID=E0S7V0_ENCIT|nr:uncharacterized protein Eint_070210 [Encephalitozoon intestinalis ATCC 50506]ADM11785.1 hypothetical protein Eint_070210 [Encephalitozoon intestinalis ATCC 50506]UTX45533.1 ras-specific guanine nucleotide-releasing factor [Encephalitozoon intestinalis]